MAAPACPKVGKLPDDYSSLLPRGVPPVERAPTSFFPYQTIGPENTTWYFPIALPMTSPTGVFIPKGFAYEQKVDVILYFHGNKVVEGNRDFQTIYQYWHGNVYNVKLREDVNSAGKHALLVAPTMGDYPGYAMSGNADLGIFGTPGGGNCFLDHVMEWLGKYEPRYSLNNVTPQVRKVMLAGHSGGGNPIHIQMNPMKAQVCEIWCFDVVYGTVSDWVDFAVYNPTKTLTFYHAVQSLPSLRKLIKLKEDTEKARGKPIDNLKINDAGKHHYPALTNNFRNQVKMSSLP